jgi:DnaJ family protein C protein 17
MNRAEEMKQQARAALFSTNDRQSSATGKPLFSSGSSSNFFKSTNIPTFKVV